MAEIRVSPAMLLTVCAMACTGPAAAADLQFYKSGATALTEPLVGKPFWSLQAQCAGVFGAGYGYEVARQKSRAAEADEAWGEAMLNDSIARLQEDRSLDRQAALQIAAQEVERGRDQGKKALDEDGTGADGKWNYLRSTCLDVSEAYQRRNRR